MKIRPPAAMHQKQELDISCEREVEGGLTTKGWFSGYDEKGRIEDHR